MENSYLTLGIGALLVIVVVAFISKSFSAKLSKSGFNIRTDKKDTSGKVEVTKVKRSEIDITSKKEQSIKVDEIDKSKIKIR